METIVISQICQNFSLQNFVSYGSFSLLYCLSQPYVDDTHISTLKFGALKISCKLNMLYFTLL